MQRLPGEASDDLEVQRRVDYDPHVVCLVLQFSAGGANGVYDDRQCLQFTVRRGPKDGGPCQVVLR